MWLEEWLHKGHETTASMQKNLRECTGTRHTPRARAPASFAPILLGMTAPRRAALIFEADLIERHLVEWPRS